MSSISQADYVAMLARTRKRVEQPPLGTIATEATLHEQIIEHCRSNGWIAFHGSMAHRTYRTPGEPDFVLLLPNGRALLVECKRPGGKLSVDQQGIHAWAAKLGWTIHTVYSFSEFLELVNTL